MHEPYDPYSPQAMFSRIIQRLDDQDREAKEYRETTLAKLYSIEEQTLRTNGRVTKIESWKDIMEGKAALLASLATAICLLFAWIYENFIKNS